MKHTTDQATRGDEGLGSLLQTSKMSTPSDHIVVAYHKHNKNKQTPSTLSHTDLNDTPIIHVVVYRNQASTDAIKVLRSTAVAYCTQPIFTHKEAFGGWVLMSVTRGRPTYFRPPG